LIKNILFSLITLAIACMGINLYKKNVLFIKADYSDAPVSYGLAKHCNPTAGPYFGQIRGDDDSKGQNFGSLIFATADNAGGKNDEDAFSYGGNNTLVTSTSLPLFINEIRAEEPVYTLTIPIKSANPGDPVRGWIDFNGNEKFEDDEKAGTVYKDGASVILTWRLPLQLNATLTYLRIRTCKQMYAEEIEFANSTATTGEVEDHVVRIIKSIIPSPEQKEYVDFMPFNEINGIRAIAPIINNLKIGDKKIHIKVLNNPEIIGINSRHDAGITGLRIGHEEQTIRDKKNPIIVIFKLAALLENVNFQIIDIDGGDRIKIEGFKKGAPVSFSINSLTDNYFYQFNATLNEVYSNGSTDEGSDSLNPSALDMAINIGFNDFIDSIKLTYTDDYVKISGTFTIGNFSARKYNLPKVLVQNFIAAETEGTINLSWKIPSVLHLSSYLIERSYDGVLYETIGTKLITNSYDTAFAFDDKTLAPVVQYCYYRIKMVEIDKHYSYSPVVRVRKKGSVSLSGFKTSNAEFTATIDLMLLIDMPGKIKVNMYNYEGAKTGYWEFEDKKKNDIFLLGNFDKLPEDTYYIEIINQNKKYLIEVYKNISPAMEAPAA
jgi:hypothetical protein